MTEEHKEAIRAANRRPDVRLKKSLAGKKFYSDPENRAKLSDLMKKMYQEDPDIVLKHSISLKKRFSDPENLAKHRENIKKAYHEHPEYGKKISERLKKYYSDPENKIKCIERRRNRKDDLEYRKKVSESMKKFWANKTPEEREKLAAKFSEAQHRDEVRDKISIASRKNNMKIREERRRKNKDSKIKAMKRQDRVGKFYEERDKYYIMTKKIDNARNYRLITSTESFLRFLSPSK